MLPSTEAAPRRTPSVAPRPRPGSRTAPVLLLAALAALLHAPVLGGERALIGVHTDQLAPWRSTVAPERLAALEARSLPLASDKTLMFHPQLLVAMERMRSGEVPLWNPYNLCGVPLLAQAVHGALHPPNALLWLLPLPGAYGWLAALQTFLAALFAYLLARELGVGALAALLAGTCFALCGFLAVRAHWFQIQGASIYLPLVLWGVERSWSAAPRGAAVAIGTGLGFSFLAGFPQSSLLTAYAAALWCAARFVSTARDGGSWRSPAAVRAAARVAAGLLLGVLLGLPQIAPAAEVVGGGESTRAHVEPEIVAALGMAPASLARVVLPNAFGAPHQLAGHELVALRARGALSYAFQKGAGGHHVETASTIGVAGLLLALLGLGAVRRGRLLAAALMLGGLLLALDTPLLLVVLRLPGLDTADPRRFLLLFGMGGALLAALGLQRVLDGRVPPAARAAVRWSAWAAALGAAAFAFLVRWPELVDWIGARLSRATGVPAAAIAEAGPAFALDVSILRLALAQLAGLLLACSFALRVAVRAPRAAAVLLLLLAAGELGLLARQSITALPASGFFAPPPQLEALRGDGTGRLIRFDPGEADPLRYQLPPNTALPFGVRDVSGYITLAPRRVEALHELLEADTTFGVGTAALARPESLDSPLLDVMAVDRVLSAVPLERDGFTLLAEVGEAWLYRHENALPRARLVPARAVRRVPPPPRLGPFLPGQPAPRDSWYGDPGGLGPFGRDPVSTPIVEHDGPADALAAVAPAPTQPWGAARITRDDPEHVALSVDAPEDAWLLLADTYMPGWSATLDGAPAPIHAANLAFRAVRVPAGAHEVTFTYASPAWTWGARAGLAAAAILVVLAASSLWSWRRSTRAAG